jgi:hypothetical protein
MVDLDPETTIATRRSLLDRATETNALVAAFHLHRTGRLEQVDKAYRFSPHSAGHQTTQPRNSSIVRSDPQTPNRSQSHGPIATGQGR